MLIRPGLTNKNHIYSTALRENPPQKNNILKVIVDTKVNTNQSNTVYS